MLVKSRLAEYNACISNITARVPSDEGLGYCDCAGQWEAGPSLDAGGGGDENY